MIPLILALTLTLAEDKPLSGAVILVDPGHGGQSYSRSYTGGTRGIKSKLSESELNIRVGLELVRQLEAKGATVHVTRVADHRLSREGSSNSDELHARVDFIEHYNPHFFLSVHHNAAGATATGHTSLYKHNAADDTLYESLATFVNDALAEAVPGPKRKLIKGNYHILRETDTPGTISEAGFLTNEAFDAIANEPGFAAKEAAAIANGAMAYWAKHKEYLVSLRAKLAKDRAAKPRDPKTITAIDLNPAFCKNMAERVAAVTGGKPFDPKTVNETITKFKRVVVMDPKATFDVSASFDGTAVRLTGNVSERALHDQLIDLFVAMKWFAIRNDIVIPKAKP